VESRADLFSANTGLRTLTFDTLEITERTPRVYVWLPFLLSQITSRYIEEISFILVWHELDIIESVDLELVQDIITKRILRGLKRVVFLIRGTVDPVRASHAIRARMDQLDEKGLLVFRRGT
jgi:hypothetical protein